jgi:hypothetical protein
MPQILTASWRTALPDDATPVAISRGTPRRLSGYRRLSALAPGPWFRSVEPATYLRLYRQILDRLDPAEIYERLIAFGDHPVLLCWECAADCHAGIVFCHRHLVAEWLEDRLGIEVPEVGHPELDRFAFLRRQGIVPPNYRDPTSGLQLATSDTGSSSGNWQASIDDRPSSCRHSVRSQAPRRYTPPDQ